MASEGSEAIAIGIIAGGGFDLSDVPTRIERLEYARK